MTTDRETWECDGCGREFPIDQMEERTHATESGEDIVVDLCPKFRGEKS